MRRLSRAVLAVSLSLGVVAPGPALATTYLALGPAAVFERADAVLTARVADVTARVDGDLVWSVVTLEVMEWLTEDPETGEDEAPREEVVLEALGGEAEGRRLIVSGAPVWRPGDEVLVALDDEEGLASPVVGFAQGLWRFEGEGLVDGEGRFLGVDAAGALVRADGPTAAAAVIDAVRQVLAGDAPEPDQQPEPADDEEPAPAEGAQDGDVEAPAAPTRPITAAYRVNDAGGPLLLSDRVAEAAAAWRALAPDAIEIAVAADARHAFAYGDEALFGQDVLTITLAEGGDVRVLVRPQEHTALTAALRHEVGALLGLPPAREGVMAMALADASSAPGPGELAELAAIAAFEPADLDRDGVVGFGDLLELAAAYGRTGVNLPGDLDGDGDVDDADVELLRAAYTFAPPAGAPGEDERPQDSDDVDGDGEEGEPTGDDAGSGEDAGPADPEEPSVPGVPGEPADPEAPGEPEQPSDPEEEPDEPGDP